MTVDKLAEALHAEVLALPLPDRKVHGVYTGDLLSWVMGRAQADNAWVTIMTNVNTVAVASLADVSVVILAEQSEMEADVIAQAEAREVNLLRTPMSAYEVCLALGRLLS